VQELAATTVDAAGGKSRLRVPLARLGRPLTHLRRCVLAFRRQVEDAVLARHGQIGVFEASLVGTACIALREHMRADRLLRDNPLPGAGLTVEQWLGVSDRVVRHKQALDKALAQLGLDRAAHLSEWDRLYLPQPVQEAPVGAQNGLADQEAAPASPPPPTAKDE
jgi:hypothetical protein